MQHRPKLNSCRPGQVQLQRGYTEVELYSYQQVCLQAASGGRDSAGRPPGSRTPTVCSSIACLEGLTKAQSQLHTVILPARRSAYCSPIVVCRPSVALRRPVWFTVLSSACGKVLLWTSLPLYSKTAIQVPASVRRARPVRRL